MNVFDSLQHLLNSQYSTPAWLMIALAALVIGLLLSNIKTVWHSICRRKRGGYDAFLAHHQKMHEGERW